MTSFPKQDEAVNERYLRFAEFEVDLYEETLRRGDEKLNINRRMFQVLRLLIERRGTIVTKNEFFEKVWGGSFVEDNNLTVTVTALRKLLGDNARKAQFIENIPRKGYRFVATLSCDHSNREAASERGSNGEARAEDVDPRTSERKRFPVVLLSVGVVLILAFLGVGFSGLWSPENPSANRFDSIAVLPFENHLSGNEYLADGLTDGIINDLLRQPGLRVIDRNSAYEYKKNVSDPAAAATSLKVQTVLTGAVEQYGDVLIVNVQLTDPTTNRVLWTQQFRRRPSDLFTTQREISRAVVGVLLPDLSSSEKGRLAKDLTDDPEAYDFYLRGLYLWNKRVDVDIQKSVQMFQSAIDRDPTFAKAYVGLANAYTLVDTTGLGISLEEKNALARGAVKRALEIDPELGEAYASLAINKCYFDWDWAGADRDYQRALELNPNHATAHHWYAEFLSMQGRFEESRREYEIASSLDPLSMPIKVDLAFSYFYSRDLDASIGLLKREEERTVDRAKVYDLLYFVYREKGDFLEAVSIREKRNELDIKFGLPEEYLKWARHYIDELKLAAKSADKLDYWRAELKYGPTDPVYRATVYAKLGDADNAFAELEKAYEKRMSGMVWLKVNPEYESLRSDPRFAELLRRVGL